MSPLGLTKRIVMILKTFSLQKLNAFGTCPHHGSWYCRQCGLCNGSRDPMRFCGDDHVELICTVRANCMMLVCFVHTRAANLGPEEDDDEEESPRKLKTPTMLHKTLPTK